VGDIFVFVNSTFLTLVFFSGRACVDAPAIVPWCCYINIAG
jgi:hypothetical protein